jgi:hypothetical protein
VLVVVLAAVATAAVASTSSRPAGAAATDRTPFVQQNCPGTLAVYPPQHNYYGVPIASQITGGSLTIGSVVKTTGLSATICGLLDFPKLTSTIPAQACNASTEATGCITYGDATTTIDGLVDLPTTFTPGPTSVAVSKTAAPDGGLQLTITAQVTTHVHIARFGVDCAVGPITVTLTTQTSGPLTGAPVTGPLTLASAKIVGATFAVPGAVASFTCPEQLIPATNGLVGLPAAAGVAQFTAPLTLANSLQ